METFCWSAQMELGIPAMDEAHRTLIEELARLAETPDRQFCAGFGALTAAIERNFAEEEAAMESLALPGLRAHLEQHARVLSALHHADPYVLRGDVATGRQAVALLPQWFLVHHATFDLALAHALDLAGMAPPTPDAIPSTTHLPTGENMFKHILVPSDGSSVSDAAVRQALRFAKETGARVTGIHVTPQFHWFTYKTEMLEDTREQFARDSDMHAKKFLATIEQAAREIGVACDTVQVESDHPHQLIIDTARARQCDLIAMASHGRKGVKGLLLGSVTQKVLLHSPVPVLVLR
ncbi:hemerythrin-like metal-binding protein [Oxalobacteraceae bacterium GrIS 1.11]